MRRVLLVGNGLSTAASAGFALGPLTDGVRNRLDAVQIGQRTAREHLEVIGERLEAEGAQNPLGSGFERLIGPLDRLQSLIGIELGAIIGAVRPDLRVPLEEVGNLVRDLYVTGVGAVLSEIDALDAAANLAPALLIIEWATKGLKGSDALAIYTVNYDPLLDRALLDLRYETIARFFKRRRYSLADEFSGLPGDATAMTLAPGTHPVTALGRRAEPYLRQQSVDLIHLHGGQQWFQTPTGGVLKAALSEIRAADLYGRWLRGEEVGVRPSVVLTDQKSKAVLRAPFAEAYSRLKRDLSQADRVAIVGYGFGDEPLNEHLRLALAGTRPLGATWLINRNACAPADEPGVRTRTAAALGLAIDKLPDLLLRSLPTIVAEREKFFD